MGNVKISFQYDTKEYEENVRKFIDEVRKSQEELLKKAATFFATAAAKFSPPSIGQNKIEKKFYTRPILSLQELIANGEASSIDEYQFKAGKKFKIVNTKNGKEKAYAYCKTASEAKKLAKIANRGLARVMWGKSLPEIGVRIPNTIQALIKKSPNLEKLNYSSSSLTTNEECMSILEIENSSEKVEQFNHFAVKHGEDNAQKGMKIWARNFINNNREF